MTFTGYFTKSALSVTDADPQAEPVFDTPEARKYHLSNQVGR